MFQMFQRSLSARVVAIVACAIPSACAGIDPMDLIPAEDRQVIEDDGGLDPPAEKISVDELLARARGDTVNAPQTMTLSFDALGGRKIAGQRTELLAMLDASPGAASFRAEIAFGPTPNGPAAARVLKGLDRARQVQQWLVSSVASIHIRFDPDLVPGIVTVKVVSTASAEDA